VTLDSSDLSGRTTSSSRIADQIEEINGQPVRRVLNRNYRTMVDKMFSYARLYKLAQEQYFRLEHIRWQYFKFFLWHICKGSL
jgi:hypothetical protein